VVIIDPARGAQDHFKIDAGIVKGLCTAMAKNLPW
jgi:hypothetical protein